MERDEMVLQRWIVIERRCNWNAVSLLSLEWWAVRRWPRSQKKELPLKLIGPNVSKARGKKICVRSNLAFLLFPIGTSSRNWRGILSGMIRPCIIDGHIPGQAPPSLPRDTLYIFKGSPLVILTCIIGRPVVGTILNNLLFYYVRNFASCVLSWQ